MTMSPSSTSRRVKILPQQDGFTMILVLGVMLVTSLLLVAVFTAANGEIHLTKTDRAEKKAYYAAEAGIQDYEYHLTQDGNYLSYCTEPTPANPALNQVGASPLKKAEVPKASSSSEATHEEYAIQLLPAESAPAGDRKCDKNNLVETMLEEKSEGAVGTFRIESTGYSEGAERTIVATFRNLNFVSFVWYTKYETGDPSVYGEPPTTPVSLPNYYIECGNFYGVRPAQGGTPLRCANNFFFGGESVNGPMHTEDHAGICGSPVFGRNKNDRIEFGNGGNKEGEGYSNEGCGQSATPTFKGNHIPPAEVPSIEPPPGDEEIQHIVEPAYLYTGKTEIVLEGTTMTVTEHKGAGAPTEVVKTAVAYPPNGVIYVKGACSEPYSPFGPTPRYSGNELNKPTDTTCGNVYIHGKYEDSLTVVAENDVIINGNITTPTSGETPTSNALLGLIANNFVRIYHPVVETYEVEHYTPKTEAGTGTNGETCNSGFSYNATLKLCVEKPKSGYSFHESELIDAKPCNTYQSRVETYLSNGKCEYTDAGLFDCDAPNATSKDLNEPIIYAAMLAVKHGVIVDNFSCGEPGQLGSGGKEGKLNVYGAVAGLYTNGYSGSNYESKFHGYGYNANYDNRLQIEEPPHFLNPIQAAWYVQRQTVAPNP
jgi:Tfp pilus assembly protein PilX